MLSNYISQSIGITKYSLLELRKTEFAHGVCAENSLGLCLWCVFLRQSRSVIQMSSYMLVILIPQVTELQDCDTRPSFT